MEFVLGGTSSAMACLFTNPMDVAKTRLQLQGELRAPGQYAIHYRNVVHAFCTIAHSEGVMALQKGLVPALCYNFVMNFARLGTYQTFVNMGFTQSTSAGGARRESTFKCIVSGSLAGAVSAVAASPFAMIKTHLQSRASHSIAVGTQHSYSSTSSAVHSIVRAHGIAGLWRGVSGAIARLAVGSGSQLATFSMCKQWLVQHDFAPSSGGVAAALPASFASGFATTLFMTPFEVLSLRLYNQPVDSQGRGMLYKNLLNCALKVARTEGLRAFYKGTTAVYFRIGPQTTLNLLFWDEGRRLWYGAASSGVS